MTGFRKHIEMAGNHTRNPNNKFYSNYAYQHDSRFEILINVTLANSSSGI